jgi:choice-of-anchor B domain-containing protein
MLLRRFAFLIFTLCCCHTAPMAQDALDMAFLSRWDDDSLPRASPGNLNLQYSGCWGMAINGREIAVLGGAAHILFFDVTDPCKPRLIRKAPSNFTTVWREFKSYRNRIYAVSDNTAEGLRIFDLSQAPDTIVETYTSNALFQRSHTIALDTISVRIYLNGSDIANQGVAVLDVRQNPDSPTLLGAPLLPGGYIHDSYVRGDTLYASHGFRGYFVYNMRNPSNPALLAQLSTGVLGYHHNSWLTADGKYAFYTEEIPTGRPVGVIDLQQMGDGEIEVAHTFLDSLLSNGGPLRPIPHNVYIRGNLLFNSQYEDGLLVYDISNPLAPRWVAYYDTHPQNTKYNRYYGNWGNYPWLPSGNIIAGDMQNGLFMLRLCPRAPVNTPFPAHVFPNPANDAFFILLPEARSKPWTFNLYNSAGQLVRFGTTEVTCIRIPCDDLAAGVYQLNLSGGDSGSRTVPVLIAH